MKTLFLATLISVALLGKAYAQDTNPNAAIATIKTKLESQLIKKTAPDFTLIDLDGKKVTLSDLKGKVVVIDFWATWCKPCISSFPGMQATIEKYKSDKDVVFLFIDTWEQSPNYRSEVEYFIKNNGYNFQVLFDEMQDPQKSVTTAYDVKGIPNKVIIDKEGFIRLQSAGSGRNIEQIITEMSAKIELVKEAI